MDLDFASLTRAIAETSLQRLAPLLEPAYLDSITQGDFPRWRRLLRELPALEPSSVNFGDVVRIGTADDVDGEAADALRAQLMAFIPWRKGPFELFGVHIDSEWACQLKWSRLAHRISPLAGRSVLDVGCGNGYYGFRMLEQGARQVLGIDPHLAYVAQFWALKHFQPTLPLYVIPATLEQLPERLTAFDTVFSMGVLYHRRSPIDHLKQLHGCLVEGGELVLETLYVDGDEGYSLTPVDRYARMSNVWFVPSVKTLMRWLARCGFSDMEVVDESVTTIQEQRQTDWMPFDSLGDALSPTDPTVTIEDLPAPRRVVVRARRT